MCKAKEINKKIIETLEEGIRLYENTDRNLTAVENKILDVEHLIENEDFNEEEGFYLSKTLKKLRIKRRELKNEKQTLKILYDTIEKTTNIEFFRQSLSKIEKNDDKLQNLKKYKIYNPRVLKDVSIENIEDFCKNI